MRSGNVQLEVTSKHKPCLIVSKLLSPAACIYNPRKFSLEIPVHVTNSKINLALHANATDSIERYSTLIRSSLELVTFELEKRKINAYVGMVNVVCGPQVRSCHICNNRIEVLFTLIPDI